MHDDLKNALNMYLLQELHGISYNDLLRERNRLRDRVKELEEENEKLKEELDEALECEDPVLVAHKKIGEFITPLVTPQTISKARVAREHREGIPFDESSVKEI